MFSSSWSVGTHGCMQTELKYKSGIHTLYLNMLVVAVVKVLSSLPCFVNQLSVALVTKISAACWHATKYLRARRTKFV